MDQSKSQQEQNWHCGILNTVMNKLVYSSMYTKEIMRWKQGEKTDRKCKEWRSNVGTEGVFKEDKRMWNRINDQRT